MSVYRLYEAYKAWKDRPALQTFHELVESGFDGRCKWSRMRKTIRVIKNLLTGKYERFYQYYERKFDNN